MLPEQVWAFAIVVLFCAFVTQQMSAAALPGSKHSHQSAHVLVSWAFSSLSLVTVRHHPCVQLLLCEVLTLPLVPLNSIHQGRLAGLSFNGGLLCRAGHSQAQGFGRLDAPRR